MMARHLTPILAVLALSSLPALALADDVTYPTIEARWVDGQRLSSPAERSGRDDTTYPERTIEIALGPPRVRAGWDDVEYPVLNRVAARRPAAQASR